MRISLRGNRKLERGGSMTQATTSIQAYQQKIKNGSLKTDKQKVYELIKQLGPVTSKELEMWMKKPKHTFSGRFTELQNEGLIMPVEIENNHKKYAELKSEK